MGSLRNKKIMGWRQLFLLFIVSIFNMGNLWNIAEARFTQDTNGPVASSLSARRLPVAAAIGESSAHKGLIGVGIDSTKSDLGTSGNSAAVTPKSPPYNTAEVVGQKTSPMNTQGPTCEELRAMWIFSKRQSRAAEFTNEIPTYRDPFGLKIWKPYYSVTRNILGSVRMIPWIGDRYPSPVFGRVISREPQTRLRGQRGRHFGADSSSSPRMYGAEEKSAFTYHSGYGSRNINGFRRPSQYRYIGDNASTADEANSNLVKVQGSFQRLKELIWTERARELTQQRKAEELAVRAAVLKEIASGHSVQSPYKHSFKSESSFSDENRNPDRNIYQHFKDMNNLIAKSQSHFIRGNGNIDKNINNKNSSKRNATIERNDSTHNRKVTNNDNIRSDIMSYFGGISRTSDLRNYMSKNVSPNNNRSYHKSVSLF